MEISRQRQWQHRVESMLTAAPVHCSPTLTVYFRDREPAGSLRQAAQWLSAHPDSVLVVIGMEAVTTEECVCTGGSGLIWETVLTLDPGQPDDR